MSDNSDVQVILTHPQLDEYSEYEEVTHLDGHIFVEGRQAGNISATIVNRKRIPKGAFCRAFEAQSATIKWIGGVLMEPQRGRTKLKSLVNHDSPDFAWMLIDSFHVEKEFKSRSYNNVATIALRKFLQNSYMCRNVQGDGDSWKFSSVAYVLNPAEAMSAEESLSWKSFQERNEEFELAAIMGESLRLRENFYHEKEYWDNRLDVLARKDSIPFLRNGFFQDAAVVSCGGPDNARILVTSHDHFCEPLKSFSEVSNIEFSASLRAPPTHPTGKDGKLFEYAMDVCANWDYKIGNLSLAAVKEAIKEDVQKFVDSGASISRSHVLHVACQNNAYAAVQVLLEMEPTAIDRLDAHNYTPLMLAAINAAERSSISGIPETKIIDCLLLKGANKEVQGRDGMTAYGHFVNTRIERSTTKGFASCSLRGFLFGTASEQNVQIKLRPTSGPVAADLLGGKQAGFVHYIDQESTKVAEDAIIGYDSDDYELLRPMMNKTFSGW